MYVAIWFYIATAHHRGGAAHRQLAWKCRPALFKSYSMYAGVQDALVQWWYGHNAVAFFLTTPYLGPDVLLPAQGGRTGRCFQLPAFDHPFLGADLHLHLGGPHHLLYTALPDWAQSLGMVFSVMLVAPSWGGMLNGLLTLRGAWDKVRAGPDAEVHGGGGDGLRHGHARRPDARHQERQRALALHRLDHRPRAHRRAGLERFPHLQRALLAVPAALQHQALVHQAGQLPFLDRRCWA